MKIANLCSFLFLSLGKNGVYYVVQIISKLLDPKAPEFTASFIGRLVILLIAKLGTQLGENLDLILRAVLSKLQQAESLSVIQVTFDMPQPEPIFTNIIILIRIKI